MRGGILSVRCLLLTNRPLSDQNLRFQRNEVWSQGRDQKKRSNHLEEHEFLFHRRSDQRHSSPKITETIFWWRMPTKSLTGYTWPTNDVGLNCPSPLTPGVFSVNTRTRPTDGVRALHALTWVSHVTQGLEHQRTGAFQGAWTPPPPPPYTEEQRQWTVTRRFFLLCVGCWGLGPPTPTLFMGQPYSHSKIGYGKSLLEQDKK